MRCEEDVFKDVEIGVFGIFNHKNRAKNLTNIAENVGKLLQKGKNEVWSSSNMRHCKYHIILGKKLMFQQVMSYFPRLKT